MIRVNLKTNPSFRSGLTSYAPLNGSTLVQTSDYAYYGNSSLLVTKSGDNNSGITSTDPIPVVVGLPYSASAYVRLPNNIPTEEEADLVLSVQWRNSVNAIVHTDTSATLTLDQDTSWARLSGVWIAPVGATVAFMLVTQVIGGTPGAHFIVDAFLFEQSNYVGGFLDNVTAAQKNTLVNAALSAPIPMVFNGLTLNADVTINDLVLNTVDEDGVLWICTGIDGWYGQAAPELPDIPRGTEDGSYDVSGRYQARVITLTGVFFPPNNDALGAARDKLVTAINLVRKSGWFRTNEEPTKAASVRLSGQPQISTVNARGRTEFSIGLRAGDPVKYEWDDSDPEGFSKFHLDADDTVGTLTNIGTADVTGVFTLTGPLGTGSSIYNAATDETITTVTALRGAGLVGTVSSVSVTNSVATIKTTASHHLIIGDEIIVSGVGIPYDTVGTTAIVLAASNSFPYTISYAIASDDLAEVASGGNVRLANNDVLTVDTYNRIVAFNGSSIGQRYKLDTLTDWIKLAPGANAIEFFDDIDHLLITTKQIVDTTVTLTSADTHYLIPGESVVIALGASADLSKKSLTSNIVTLTTKLPHGFSVGDKINVQSTEQSIINNKSATTTAATLQTVDTNGVSVSDTIVVALPTTATPSVKSLSSNVATLTTVLAHGFSAGDSVVVALPSTATVTSKLLTSNQATLTTAAAHNFQVGDSITVAMGATATITNKAKSGAVAVITTAAAHGFSTGDSVVISLPATAVQTANRSMAGSAGGYLATINTTTAHGFSVGDRVAIDTGVASVDTITNRVSTTTLATLTIGSHTFSVGEKITVSGVSNAQYNGTFYITAITGTTISYALVGATAEASVASSGSLVNNTLATGYNGNKVIETVPSSTSFTFYAWDQDVATSSTVAGTSPTLTDTTNVAFNGTKTLTSASGTQFQYNY